MEKKIKFENAQELQKKYPDTFGAPDRENLKKIKPGDYVKVCAFDERFWAEVTSVDKEVITARIDNKLLTRRLKFNEIIDVHPDNVYSILSKKVPQEITGDTEKVKQQKVVKTQKGSRL